MIAAETSVSVQQSSNRNGFDDPSRALVILNSDRRAIDRFGIETRVIAMRHGNLCERFGRAAGVVEIAHRGHSEALSGRRPTPSHIELVVAVGIGGGDRSAGNLPAHPAP